MGYVIYCFVRNLANFSAVKDFKNLVRFRFDEIIFIIEWRVSLSRSVVVSASEKMLNNWQASS